MSKRDDVSTTPDRRRVRVWFGKHPICDVTKPSVEAATYEAGMRRRFAGLRVTNHEVLATGETID
ncbi:MAG TPA: hypothetical protein VK497_00375 [Candidatus Saccharimonadales bacterium]|nr:hypothetical protein [Candidatus Saccharimonadales bacterium]